MTGDIFFSVLGYTGISIVGLTLLSMALFSKAEVLPLMRLLFFFRGLLRMCSWRYFSGWYCSGRMFPCREFSWRCLSWRDSGLPRSGAVFFMTGQTSFPKSRLSSSSQPLPLTALNWRVLMPFTWGLIKFWLHTDIIRKLLRKLARFKSSYAVRNASGYASSAFRTNRVTRMESTWLELLEAASYLDFSGSYRIVWKSDTSFVGFFSMEVFEGIWLEISFLE